MQTMSTPASESGVPGRAAREISYAFAAETRAGRAVIRSIENLTGRQRLLRMAEGYERDVAAGRDFWEVMRARYRLDIAVEGLANIPAEGPVVVVANHPYGILDGLALGHTLAAARGEFRIMAHTVFRRAKELERVVLPIDFAGTRAARAVNIATRKAALGHLAEGGCIGIFPGGTVSTAATPFARPMDPHWKTFTARMVLRSGAQVVPLFFEGRNSRAFQIASHLHPSLRVALLISEFGARVGGGIRAHVGRPVPPDEIAAHARDPHALMEHLRQATYRLDPRPMRGCPHGLYLG